MRYRENNKIEVRVEVLRNGGVYTTLTPVRPVEVECTSDSELKMSMRGTFLPVNAGELPDSTLEYTVQVNGVDGASYGFSLDTSTGMYVSGNKGIANSAAVARIAITAERSCVMVLSCKNAAEKNCDYGVVYKVDTDGGVTNTVAAADVLQSYKGVTHTDAVDLEIAIPAGTHFVDVKFLKDGSQNTEPDTFSFAIKGVTEKNTIKKGILWVTDRIRPVLIVNGEEYSVGRYIATTPCEKRENGITVWEIEAYSVLYLASRVCVEENYRISAGTNYIAAIQGLLRTAGITEYEADATTLVLAADRADWTVGTPVLRIVNALLAEINYDPAWVDLKGKVHLTKYKAPSMDAIDHIYNAGQNSIIEDAYTVSSDYFDKANVFRCVCTSPDLDAPLSAEAENNDENSPFSTVSMGIRILDYEEVESVPDLATLQERVQNKLTKSLQAKEEITFITALAPEHGVYDTVAIGLDGVTGIYRETAWSMTLDASGNMRHTAERVVLQ